MSIVFAAALGHAPGITAWTEAAEDGQRQRLAAGFAELRRRLVAARPEVMVVFTSEHWTNFFLDHISAFCIGRGEHFSGPVEPWLRINPTQIPGDPDLAGRILEHCYTSDLEPGFAHEMKFDHGTMVPLHFLIPDMDIPVVPIMINTLAAPQPSPRRSFALGQAVGEVVRADPRRIALVATGGMSHDPGEVNHGIIDAEFDRHFLAEMQHARLDALASHSVADLLKGGAGAVELLSWIALAGAMARFTGQVLAYEAVVPWATGIGIMGFDVTDAT